MSDPIAPGEATPLVDAEHETSPENGPVSPQCYGRMTALARSLERQLQEYKVGFAAANERADMATTALALRDDEMRGHMRIEDDLKEELRQAQEENKKWLAKAMLYAPELARAQARVSALEKERDVLKHHIAVTEAISAGKPTE